MSDARKYWSLSTRRYSATTISPLLPVTRSTSLKRASADQPIGVFLQQEALLDADARRVLHLLYVVLVRGVETGKRRIGERHPGAGLRASAGARRALATRIRTRIERGRHGDVGNADAAERVPCWSRSTVTGSVEKLMAMRSADGGRTAVSIHRAIASYAASNTRYRIDAASRRIHAIRGVGKYSNHADVPEAHGAVHHEVVIVGVRCARDLPTDEIARYRSAARVLEGDDVPFAGNLQHLGVGVLANLRAERPAEHETRRRWARAGARC